MIATIGKSVEQDQIGTFEVKRAGVSQAGLEFIIDSLSDNLYSNIKDTIVREYTSNMQDAIAIENKLDKPCFIIFSNNPDDNTDWIEFKDFGGGMTPDFMNKVFMNWGESTKRSDNIQIGGFGLGSKCGLAYQNEIYITTIVNRNCWEYILYKTSTLPELTLLNSYVTDEPNGTTIKIQIKDSYDLREFKTACKDQTALFNNVVIIGINDDYTLEHKIYEHEMFYYVPNTMSGHKKIANGKVLYVLNTSSLPADTRAIRDRIFRTGIVPRFDIGELDITLSRENVKYTEKSISTLDRKFIEIDQYLYDYIKKIFDSTMDAVTRYAANTFYIDDKKEVCLDLSDYVKLYLNRTKNHFFETDQYLIRACIDANYGYGNTFDNILKLKYFINRSDLNSDKYIKYKLNYFGIENLRDVIVVNDDLTYREYKSFHFEFITSNKNRYSYLKNSRIGYKVFAKNFLVNSIRKHKINIHSVPTEYIEEQLRIKEEEEALKRKQKAQITKEKRELNKKLKAETIQKDKEERLKEFKDEQYSTKSGIVLHFDLENYLRGGAGVEWKRGISISEITHIVLTESKFERQILAYLASTLNINLVIAKYTGDSSERRNSFKNTTSITDFFVNKHTKNLLEICKNNVIIIKSSDDLVKFIYSLPVFPEEILKNFFRASKYTYLKGNHNTSNKDFYYLYYLTKFTKYHTKELLQYNTQRDFIYDRITFFRCDNSPYPFVNDKLNNLVKYIDEEADYVYQVTSEIRFLFPIIRDSKSRDIIQNNPEILHIYLKSCNIKFLKSLKQIKNEFKESNSEPDQFYE